MSSKVGKSNIIVRGLKGVVRSVDQASEKRAVSIGEKRANSRNVVNFSGNGKNEMYSNMPMKSGKDRARSIGEKRGDALNIMDYSKPAATPAKVVQEAW
ncbi:hypothetical protein NDN08_001096 [Rhodosorus marinus]|uniref:50S ribosomal protein L24, chloroplastic n=1 Tax=Rhodosorus marinus TaxID=101924 RepID=A0AAV8UPY8_9RHOD|nr:hypothetical protein NDN08_001096 [Rhodosorus marinus]